MGHRRLRGARSPLAGTACLGLLVALTSCSHDEPPTTASAPDWGTYDLGSSVEVDNGAGLAVRADSTDASVDVTLELREGSSAVDWAYGAFSQAGPVTEISVEGELAGPLSVTFPTGEGAPSADSPDDVPVVLRNDPDLGWYPVAVGDPGGTASEERERFSEHAGGWWDPRGWWSDTVSRAQRMTGMRSEPLACENDGPSWAQVQSPALDVVHVCLTTNRQEPAERAEVRLKNNRGVTQEVVIPSGVAYAWVQGQSDPVREFVRTSIGGGRDIVLLAPEQEMTVGFTRPGGGAPTSPRITATVSGMAMAFDMLYRLADLGQGSTSTLVAVVALADCTKALSWAGDWPEGLAGVQRIAEVAWDCLMGVADDVGKVDSLAQQVVALGSGVSQIDVRADWQRFGHQVDAVKGGLKVLAKASKVVEVAKMGLAYWEQVGELLGQMAAGTSSLTDTVVRLSPPAAPKPEAQPVTLDFGGGIVGLESPAPEEAAVRFLTERLGPPDDVFPDAMCEMGAPAGRRYTWGNLTILVLDDMTGYPAYAAGPSLVGWEYWEIKTGADRQRLSTTDGLRLGSTLDEVRAAVPDGELGEDFGGTYYRYSSGDLWNMTFTFDMETSTEVVAISSGLGCGE